MEKSHARGPPDTKLVSHAYDDFPNLFGFVIVPTVSPVLFVTLDTAKHRRNASALLGLQSENSSLAIYTKPPFLYRTKLV
jgi:hypothetical protein